MQFTIFRKLLENLSENQDFVLITCVDTSGSTPARTGFRMIVHADGDQIGTVGGGNLEHTARRMALELLESGKPAFMKTFSMEKDLNMTCGGQCSLLFEPHSPWRLTIVGGGHVAQATAPLAASVGFLVNILDDRPEIAEHSWPEGVHVEIGDVEELCARQKAGARHAALVMTYMHKKDFEAAAALSAHPFRYFGIIGSRKKALGLKKSLMEKGVPADVVERIRTPVGVPVGAQTPAEIAVSIVAELIAIRAGESLMPWM